MVGSVVPGIGTAIGAGAGALIGGIGGWLKGRGKDKMAEADARNKNAQNKWKYDFKKSDWAGERGWQRKKRGRSHAFRSQLLAAIMGNSKYGMSKLFPGFAQLQQSYQPEKVVNPYEAAGAPPELEAVKGGTGAAIGAGLGGAMSGATSGAKVGGMFD
jgi:hypothetical protein